jgi:nucleolar protein 6
MAGGRKSCENHNHAAPEGEGEETNPSILQLDGKRAVTGSKRYILFVGSLPYKASDCDIKKHFKDTPISVRIRTDKATKKPRGFAFLEFGSREDLEAALYLHHSKFMGRKINVELTPGGGGGGENRRARIKERNERLNAERASAAAANK